MQLGNVAAIILYMYVVHNIMCVKLMFIKRIRVIKLNVLFNS